VKVEGAEKVEELECVGKDDALDNAHTIQLNTLCLLQVLEAVKCVLE
jgi:hypothetical protein